MSSATAWSFVTCVTFGAFGTLGTVCSSCTSKADGTHVENGGHGMGGSAGISAGGSGASGGMTGGTSGGSAGRGNGSGGSAADGATGGSANNGTGGNGTGGAIAGTGGDESSAGRGSGGRGGVGGSGAYAGVGGVGGASAASGGTSGSPGGSGEAGQPGTDCHVSDEFTGTTLDSCWQILNGSASMPLIQIAEAGGKLHLSAMGNQGGVWYQGATKSLVYQVVNASAFRLTTTAHSRKASDSDALPTKDLHVGGLMVRNPTSMGGNTENYVFIMLGHSENNNGMVHQGIEFKSTFNGCSDWNEPDWQVNFDVPDADLRICRIGDEFRHYKRVPGDPDWILAEAPSGTCSGNVVHDSVLTRTDMPNTVQVGLALNFNAPSDLDVAFDYIHYDELPPNATAADCTSD